MHTYANAIALIRNSGEIHFILGDEVVRLMEYSSWYHAFYTFSHIQLSDRCVQSYFPAHLTMQKFTGKTYRYLSTYHLAGIRIRRLSRREMRTVDLAEFLTAIDQASLACSV